MPFPQPIVADVIWPGVLLARRLVAWYSIAGGLVLEWLVVWLGFPERPLRAAGMALTMNLFSSIAGLALIPILGFGWELIASSFYSSLGGTFNPLTWFVTVLLAAVANACIELFILVRFFEVPTSRRNFLLLVFANTLSVSLAFLTFLVFPS